MTSTKLERKYGVVILLDALGASRFSDKKINEFLSARTEINSIIRDLATKLTDIAKFKEPSIFTFGDTIIITTELKSEESIYPQIFAIILLMRKYLFCSLKQGILLRGSFSIGTYIEESDSNTVMGEAVTDAASWYEKSEWMGLSCTPKTNNILEYHVLDEDDNFEYIHKYDVPLKDGKTFNLHTINWPSLFHDKHTLKSRMKNNPKKWFLEILKDLPVPIGAETKFENMKKYYTFVEDNIKNKSFQ